MSEDDVKTAEEKFREELEKLPKDKDGKFAMDPESMMSFVRNQARASERSQHKNRRSTRLNEDVAKNLFSDLTKGKFSTPNEAAEAAEGEEAGEEIIIEEDTLTDLLAEAFNNRTGSTANITVADLMKGNANKCTKNITKDEDSPLHDVTVQGLIRA